MTKQTRYGYFPLRVPKYIHQNGIRLDGEVKVYRLGPRGGVKDFEGVYRLREIPEHFPNSEPMKRGHLKGGWTEYPDTFADATWRYKINYPKSPKNDAIRYLSRLMTKQALRDVRNASIKGRVKESE